MTQFMHLHLNREVLTSLGHPQISYLGTTFTTPSTRPQKVLNILGLFTQSISIGHPINKFNPLFDLDYLYRPQSAEY